MTQPGENRKEHFEFSGFRLDPLRGVLLGTDGERIALKPKVFDTLVCLVERHGQLLDKPTLMHAVWGEVHVEENSLSQHISTLRSVLGESPGENRFIVTVPGRGYRFVARVTRVFDAEGAKADEIAVPDDTAADTSVSAWTAQASGRPRLRYVSFAVLVLAAVTLLYRELRPFDTTTIASTDGHTNRDVVRLKLDVVPSRSLFGGAVSGTRQAQGRPSRLAFAFSPDGRFLVYSASDGETGQLYRRAMDQQRAVPIPGTEGGFQPFFSPDGSSVGFRAGNELKRVPIVGGEVRTVVTSGFDADFAPAPPVSSWTENETILVSGSDGIYEVASHGGQLVRLTEVLESEGERVHAFPQMLPGARALLFNVVTESDVPSEWPIVVERLDSGERKVVIEAGSHPRYLASGHLAFARRGSLLAVAFDLDRLKTSGAPVVVVEDVMHAERSGDSDLNWGAAQYSVSNAGSLAYVTGGVYALEKRSLIWVDRDGNSSVVSGVPADEYFWPRFSSDGKQLVYGTGTFGAQQIWRYDIGLGIPVPVTGTDRNTHPVWSPDDTRLAFSRGGMETASLYTMTADGSGEPHSIAGAGRGFAASWSVDNVLAYVRYRGGGYDRLGIWTIRMDGKSRPELFIEAASGWPVFSPDGDWMAYVSRGTGRDEVYVRPYPEREPVHRISIDGGTRPVWSRDGRELFFRQGPRVMVVDVETEPAFRRTSRPRPLFEGPYGSSNPVRSYDIFPPNGERFVMTRPRDVAPEPVTGINIVLNWFEELQERAPAQ